MDGSAGRRDFGGLFMDFRDRKLNSKVCSCSMEISSVAVEWVNSVFWEFTKSLLETVYKSF